MSNVLIEAGALRQFWHNDGSDGFVAAYDKDITDREFARLATPNGDPATCDDYRRMFNRAVNEMVDIAKALGLSADGQSHEDIIAAIRALKVAGSDSSPVGAERKAL